MTNDIDQVCVSVADLDAPPAAPRTGEDSARLLEEAMTSLVLLRFPASLGDAAAELHALASLVAEATARIVEAVFDAIDQDHGWTEIATCLAITADEAQRRFAGHGRTVEEAPLDG
jgi:hypothetical protein